MSKKIRNIAAAACAVVCTVSMCGCSDSGYIGNVNGIEIPTGIYLYSVIFDAYNEASGKIEEDRGEDAGTAEVTVLDRTLDGKKASTWLKDAAVDKIKRFAAIETLFSDNGLSLSQEDIDAIDDSVSSLDNDLGYYAQYYGMEESSFGEFYENRGISKSSLRSIWENSYKENYVFLKYYGADGLTPVSDDEINSYLTENYASVKLLKLEFTDQQGIMLKDESDIEAVKQLAQSYADRFNAGEDWTDIRYDFDLRAAQLDAWSEAEDKYAEEKSASGEESSSEESGAGSDGDLTAVSESTPIPSAENDPAADGEGSAESANEDPATDETPAADENDAAADENAASNEQTEEKESSFGAKPFVNTGDAEFDAYCQAAIDAATAEKKESADDCDQIISKESSPLDEKITEYIWNTAADGKATLFTNTESGNYVYVVVREDITGKESWKEKQNETILHKIKDDAFDELLKGIYESYTVELDDYLVNTKYSPEKLRGIGK